jgi:hypothetical protein
MIPAATDPRWQQVLTGAVPFRPTMLASQLLVKRLLLRVQDDHSPATVAAATAELRSFFEKYERVAQDDLRQIFG